MTVLPSLLAFGLAATLLTITPGLDTAMVLRSAVAGGPRQAIAMAIGIGLGCLAWGAAVALGLGIVLTASTLAYTVLKWAGAAYLLWLGVNLLFRPRDGMADETAGPAVPVSRSGPMRRGFLTNLYERRPLFLCARLHPRHARHSVVCRPDRGNRPAQPAVASASGCSDAGQDHGRSIYRVRRETRFIVPVTRPPR
jgi:hypothetical protein